MRALPKPNPKASVRISHGANAKLRGRKGLAPIQKMLGYRKGEDGEPEIVPEEAKLVERIFDLYIAGETPLSISEILQAENPTFEGKHFTYGKGMIEGILFNVKYCGDAILQQSVTVDPIMKSGKRIRARR